MKLSPADFEAVPPEAVLGKKVGAYGVEALVRQELVSAAIPRERCTLEDIRGGEPAVNARLAREILGGTKNSGRDAVVINAGAALHLYKGITIEEGIKLAADTIDSGAAIATLEKYIRVSNEVE